MKTSQIIAAAALSLLAAAGAQAETYEGVQKPVSGLSRADVEAEAVRAAAAPNQNVTRGSRGADPFTSVADPAAVYVAGRRHRERTGPERDQRLARQQPRDLDHAQPRCHAPQAQKDGTARGQVIRSGSRQEPGSAPALPGFFVAYLRVRAR